MLKRFLILIVALGLAACGKQGAESKSHTSSVAVGHADATIVYYAMPG